MDGLLTSLIFIALIAIFWELTAHNIWRILTSKYSRKKSLFISIACFICVLIISVIGLLIYRLILEPAYPGNLSILQLSLNIFVILIILAGIFISSLLIHKEKPSAIFFVSSFFSLIGLVICNLTMTYVKILMPAESEGTIPYLLTIGIIIIICGISAALAVKFLVAPAMKELIGSLWEELRGYTSVSIVSLITYLSMMLYFNVFNPEGSFTVQIISRFIFLILYIAIYLMIIFGIKRSVKSMKINDELSLAREIQNQIFPSANAMAEIPGVKIAAVMEPCEDVCGDFYDAFIIDSEKSAFIIADVAGKGIAAALFMMQVKSFLKVNLRMDKMSDYVLTAANLEMLKNRLEFQMYYGAIVSIFETKTRRYTYSCGGQLPPILIRNGSVSECMYSGEPDLGLSDTIYTEYTVDLEKDDVILLYTDGIIDTASKSGELYGKERLMNVISKETEPDMMISAIENDLNNFSENSKLTDDVTMLAFKVL